jgi:hypothetical protein
LSNALLIFGLKASNLCLSSRFPIAGAFEAISFNSSVINNELSFSPYAYSLAKKIKQMLLSINNISFFNL